MLYEVITEDKLRISDSVEQALKFGKGTLITLDIEEEKQLKEKRIILVAKIDKHLYNLYRRIYDSKEQVAVVPANEGHCGGCFTILPSQKLSVITSYSIHYTKLYDVVFADNGVEYHAVINEKGINVHFISLHYPDQPADDSIS